MVCLAVAVRYCFFYPLLPLSTTPSTKIHADTHWLLDYTMNIAYNRCWLLPLMQCVHKLRFGKILISRVSEWIYLKFYRICCCTPSILRPWYTQFYTVGIQYLFIFEYANRTSVGFLCYLILAYSRSLLLTLSSFNKVMRYHSFAFAFAQVFPSFAVKKNWMQTFIHWVVYVFLAFPLNHQKSAWESSLLRYVEDFVDSVISPSLLCFVLLLLPLLMPFVFAYFMMIIKLFWWFVYNEDLSSFLTHSINSNTKQISFTFRYDVYLWASAYEYVC